MNPDPYGGECFADFDRTAVLAGLQYIAENPEILHVTCSPLSFWMRSDSDSGRNREDRAIRVCRKGQVLNPQSKSDYEINDRNPSGAIRFELSDYGNDFPYLDLSVFGTPSQESDGELIDEIDSEECFVYGRMKNLVLYGTCEKPLQLSCLPETGKCHVYVYSKATAVDITFHAVFAADIRRMAQL